MQLLINPASELPIYRQITHGILQGIAGGRLKPGDKVPSHRDLAEELVIAPLTVKKAYDTLEQLGYLETQRGRGTFIAAKLPVVKLAERRQQTRDAARKLLSQAYLGGLDFDDVIGLLIEADREIAAPSGKS
jgi:GntR family transcriptional regulator